MKTLFCSTLDTRAEFSVDTMTLSVIHAGHPTASSALALPKGMKQDGNDVCFSWSLQACDQKENAFSLLFSDEAAKMLFLVSVEARADLNGPVEYSGKLTNVGAQPVRVLPGTLFTFDFPFETAPTAWRFAKESGVAEGVRWSKGSFYKEGTGIYRDVLNVGTSVEAETNTNQDWNCGGMIPMLYLDGGNKGGYIGVEWTSHRILASGIEGGVRVTVDYHDGFSTVLPAGGVLDIAPIYIGLYEGDVDDGSNVFKRWFFLHKAPRNFVLNENEPLTQIDAQIDPEACGALGIQSIKWDYGWWSNEKLPGMGPGDIWKYYEGSWKLRSEGMKNYIAKFGKHTLAEYGEYMEKLGLNWTVYVLLHDAQHELEEDDQLTSVGPTGHPEWFSNRKIAGCCPVADLGNTECVEYLKRKLAAFFTENHIKGWRSDFEPIAQFSDKQNRHDANGTDVQYWCSKGFFEIVDYLIENVPGFRYESCCSGGAMKDYATMRRTGVFNNDDSADYISLRTVFYDSSYCFPASQLQAPLDPGSFTPECEKFYAGIGDKDFGFRSAIMGGVMLAAWCGHDETGHIAYDLESGYAKYLPLHNEKIKPLIRHADLYHILPRPDMIHWDGIQYGCRFIPENRICGAAFIFKPTDKDGETKHIPVRGLLEDVTYDVEFYERTEQNFTATGKELMENGIDVTIRESCGSDILFYVAK